MKESFYKLHENENGQIYFLLISFFKIYYDRRLSNTYLKANSKQQIPELSDDLFMSTNDFVTFKVNM